LLSRIILPTAANQSPPRRAHTELAAAGATGVLFFSQDPPRLINVPSSATSLPSSPGIRRRPEMDDQLVNCEETDDGATKCFEVNVDGRRRDEKWTAAAKRTRRCNERRSTKKRSPPR